jgi:endonuclease YncB( thermonuclease family)
MLLLLPPPEPPAIVGRASVIDGDTLEIRGQRVRVWGVDAPESRQTCERAGQTYRCGTDAANALSNWTGQRTVSCQPVGRPDRYQRIVARCSIGGEDMGAWLVSRGLALDFPRYSRRAYAAHEAQASADRAGVWAGDFQKPWDWRAR